MRAVDVGADVPSSAWCRSLSAGHPDLRIRIRTIFPTGGGRMVEVLELGAPDWRASLATLAATPGIEGIEIIEEGPAHGVVRMNVPLCPLAAAAAATGVVPEMPIEVVDGRERVRVRADAARVRGFLAQLGTEAHPEVVGAGTRDSADPLTPRQREILQIAVREGYYDYPRRITLTDLAKRIGVAKSTLSESLMLIERAMLGSRAPQARGEA